jgi:hypothetical protein
MPLLARHSRNAEKRPPGAVPGAVLAAAAAFVDVLVFVFVLDEPQAVIRRTAGRIRRAALMGLRLLWC